jgi:cysteinyl-tRNA synthetase
LGSDVTLKLHNTLTRTKEDFVPLDPMNVRMYVCGPTVYDFAHIGNARPAIVFDVMYRLLRHVYGAEHVTYVRNITDVDDKINARAARDFPDKPLNEAIRAVTEKTANQYFADTAALGCLEPTVQPRATDNIDGMQKLIGQLIANHHAYEAKQVGEVLFDVNSMPDYGALSGRDLENNLAGARVEVESHKHHAADFVLWKASSPEEPGWDSPWGRGRPGWHIECSAMSERYLGQIFDIHAGGLDLIFPHHENEIAQSRCAHGTQTMARYWMHNGFLQVEGQKMSKSLGNFFTIRELLDTEVLGGRRWPGEVLRLAMLMTHYREPIDFTAKRLEEAEDKLRGWQRTASAAKGTGTVDASVIEALSDDLNFHRASVAMDVIARKANRGVETAVECLAATLGFFGFSKDGLLADAAGFDHSRVHDAVNARLAALNSKDFAKADEIRAALLAEGIQLMDGKNEAGERITKWEVKR